jgi:hypothetical protein
MPHARPLRIDVAGGGPPGLAFALVLLAHGVEVRIRVLDLRWRHLRPGAPAQAGPLLRKSGFTSATGHPSLDEGFPPTRAVRRATVPVRPDHLFAR